MVDFYEQVTTPACHQALNYLRQQPFIGGFYLAGGTALALQIGHRVSTDLDWFSASHRLLAPEREAIRRALQGASGQAPDDSGQFVVASEQDGLMFTRLFGSDVSFIHQPSPVRANGRVSGDTACLAHRHRADETRRHQLTGHTPRLH